MGKSSTDATALTPDVDKGRKRKEKDKLEAEAAAAALEVEKSNKKEKGKLEAAPPEVEKSKKKKDKSKKRKEAEAHTKGDVLEYNGDCKAGQSPIPDEMKRKRKRKRESGAATSSAGEDTEGLDGSKGGEKLMAAEDESTKKNGKDEQSPAPTTETQVKTLFVGNMGLDTNVEQILSLFTRHGIDVSDCMLPCHEGTSRGFCYIDCASAVDANKAIATLCGYKYKGQPLVVELSKQNLTEMRNMFSISNRGLRTTVLVSGFEPTAEDHLKKSLRIHFAECDISRIRVVISQGKAYLDFNDNDSFCKAIDLDGSVIDGRPITVTEATSRAPGAGPAYFCVLCGGGGIFCTTCGADIGGTCSHLEHSRTNTDPNTNLAGSSQAGHETNTRNKKRTVYVRKLDMRFGKEQMHKALENLFSKCGRMTDIRIPASDDGAIRGYGFIEFEDKKSALKALELDGARIGRLKLSVREFREPQSTAGS